MLYIVLFKELKFKNKTELEAKILNKMSNIKVKFDYLIRKDDYGKGHLCSDRKDFNKYIYKLSRENTKRDFVFLCKYNLLKFDYCLKGNENIKTLLVEIFDDSALKTPAICSATNVRKLYLNNNNYVSATDRDNYILDSVDYFVNDEDMTLEVVNDYSRHVFNNDVNVYKPEKGLSSKKHHCSSFKDCSIAKQHRRFTPFGIKHKTPLSSFGNATNPKYVFIDFYPAYHGSGKLGIPFYDNKEGNLLLSVLYNLNISLFDCLFINAIKCTPTNDNIRKHKIIKNNIYIECIRDINLELLENDIHKAKVCVFGQDLVNIIKDATGTDINFLRFNNLTEYVRKEKGFDMLQAEIIKKLDLKTN